MHSIFLRRLARPAFSRATMTSARPMFNMMKMTQTRMFSTPPPQFDEPEIPEEELEIMKQSLAKFAQSMQLGQHKEAQEILDAYRVELDKYFTDDHPAYCSYLNNQGMLLRFNSEFDKALELFEKVHAQYSSIFGNIHPSTANARINLATVLRDLERYDDAISHYEGALEARKELEGVDSMNYAMCLSLLSGAYREKKDYDKAYSLLKESYTTMATLNRGEENIGCATVLNSMGLLFKRWGKFERAIDCYERSFNTRLELLGPKHPETMASRHNIGELYVSMGNPEKAEEYLT